MSSAGIAVAKHAIHIYPLSRLVHARAAGWEKLLRDIEQGKERAFGYYLPLREAAILYCARQGNSFDEILLSLRHRSEEMGGRRGKRMADDNELAFRAFVEAFYPNIQAFKRDCMRDLQNGCDFAGLTLFGAPHFICVDKSGRQRFVFLLAAAWNSDDLKAYLQLLTVIVEKNYAGTADQIWCMDLRNRKTIRFGGSTRLRARCEGAARHFARLLS